MLKFQKYLFRDALRAFAIIMLTLLVLALLAQGLTWTEILQDNRQGLLIYFKVVGLGAPKALALLVPLALFIACVWSLHRMQKDAEIVVVQATGMSNWQVASPLLRLACLVAVGHLVLNLWVQPNAQRAMRDTLVEIRADLASSLIRPGQFSSSGPNLTFYARDRRGDDLQGLLISDSTNPDDVVDYLAQAGRIENVDGKPALIMRTGQIHRPGASGDLSILLFEQYVFDLTPFIREDTDTVLEASDRFLPELLRIDETNYIDVQSKDEFFAEANLRLTAPLLNIAMAFLAAIAIIGGEYRNNKYIRRIGRVTLWALALIIVHVVVKASAESTPLLSIGLWLIPTIAGFLTGRHYLNEFRHKHLFRAKPAPDAAEPV